MTTYVAAYSAERPFHTALLAELDSAGSAFRHITPNWFASVMGTGIVATAAATLPLHMPGLHEFATAVWILAASVLAVLTGAFATHWIRHRDQAKVYAAHQVMGQFYGAPAMALLTVGAGRCCSVPRSSAPPRRWPSTWCCGRPVRHWDWLWPCGFRSR